MMEIKLFKIGVNGKIDQSEMINKTESNRTKKIDFYWSVGPIWFKIIKKKPKLVWILNLKIQPVIESNFIYIYYIIKPKPIVSSN